MLHSNRAALHQQVGLLRRQFLLDGDSGGYKEGMAPAGLKVEEQEPS
jgi:hypothetical protein